MNDVQDLLKTAFFFVLALVVGMLGWFAKRNADRIDNLEKHTVTRDELERILAQARNDRNLQHQENREFLTRIEQKIDENEKRSSATRHDTNDTIHALELKLAEKFAVMDRDRRDAR